MSSLKRKTSNELNPLLQDVADHAGVSPSTVSRVLNNKPNVSGETRKKVLDIYSRIYFVEPTVRDVIGLVLPESANPFFARLGYAFEQVFERTGRLLLICSSEGRPDRELSLVKKLAGLGASGLIFISAGESSDTLLSLIASNKLPVVAFDRRIPIGNVDSVAVDSRYGILRAAEYLIAAGHSRIAYISGLLGTTTATERRDSFFDAMRQSEKSVVPEWIFEGDYSLASGRACAEKIIGMASSKRPTAVIAANDLMAIGLMQRLEEEGWSLPDQLSVIGFDDIEWSQWTYPALTTVAQPLNKLVNEAARLLIDRIESRQRKTFLPSRVVELEPVLIPRSSVTKPPFSVAEIASARTKLS